jgi:capsular polysaccharide biosynthesis protein
MTAQIESKITALSQRLFERLLAAYPKAHREEYGAAMAQLFRDQSRDAWREARWWGLALLWLRVLPDLVKTSLLEHLSSLKGRKSMFEKISEVFLPRCVPIRIFFGVFLAVFLLVFGAAAIITFILPESYASVARIKVEREAPDVPGLAGRREQLVYDPYLIQTEFEVIQSEMVLGKVIDLLDLNTVWGRKYQNGEKLKSAECIALLKHRMTLRPVRGTSFIEIRVYSEDKAEAAKIANAVAEVYRDYHRDKKWRVFATGIKSLEEQAAIQGKHVASAKEKFDRLRSELNVPNPEPTPEELQARYPSYWAAKQEWETEVSLLKTLESSIASRRVDASLPSSSLVEITDRAMPSLRPARPNKPLNLALGFLVGGVLALGLGTVAAAIALIFRKKQYEQTAVT